MSSLSLTGYVVLCMTFPSRAEAERVVQHLLEQRLVACANLVDAVMSHFWWQGKRDQAEEVLVMAKTSAEKYADVEKAVAHMHSYAVPEIIALPIIAGLPAYLEWIRDSVSTES